LTQFGVQAAFLDADVDAYLGESRLGLLADFFVQALDIDAGYLNNITHGRRA
jgi:hypothetical protein